ncbi:MAG: TspO/MBR family protein [Pseudomonadota bacterium]
MDWVSLIGFATAAMAAASSGAMFPPGAWYDDLPKPPWTPPNWLFPLAWTLLYAAIVYAALRIAPNPAAGPALALWAAQIALNGLWTPVFFGLRRIGGALIVLAGLWLAVAATLVAFWRLDTLAGILFVPYLIWVSYAAALNADILRRSRAVSAT